MRIEICYLYIYIDKVLCSGLTRLPMGINHEWKAHLSGQRWKFQMFNMDHPEQGREECRVSLWCLCLCGPVFSLWTHLCSHEKKKKKTEVGWRQTWRTGRYWLAAPSHLSVDTTLWQSHHCLATQGEMWRIDQAATATATLQHCKKWERCLHIY